MHFIVGFTTGYYIIHTAVYLILVVLETSTSRYLPMSNQFIQRIATWIADKLIVDGLAKSQGFQKFAQKTHTNVQQAKAKVKDVPNAGVFQQFKQARSNLSKEINSAKEQLKREINEEYKK